jgi:hypothetical protein
MDLIIDIVSKESGIDKEKLLSRDKTVTVSKARMILYKVLYMDNKSVIQIGKKLDRNHAAVSVGIKKVDNDANLWQEAIRMYNIYLLYDEEKEKKEQEKKLLYLEIKSMLNQGKEDKITKSKETKAIIKNIKKGAKKKVPDYKHSTYRTIYL